MLPIDLHGLLDFPLFPYTARRVVRTTEDSRMDMIFHDLLLHIFKIHTIDLVLILHQRTKYHMITIVGQTIRKSNISWGMKKYTVALGTDHVQRTDYAAKNAIFITNVLRFQTLYTISHPLPFDDRIKILFSWAEISIGGMVRSFNDRLWNRRHRRKIHIRHPHRDQVKPFFCLRRPCHPV